MASYILEVKIFIKLLQLPNFFSCGNWLQEDISVIVKLSCTVAPHEVCSFMWSFFHFFYSSAKHADIKKQVWELLLEYSSMERVCDCKIQHFKDSFLAEHVDSVALCDLRKGLKVCEHPLL
jgi:hypothetical protein